MYSTCKIEETWKWCCELRPRNFVCGEEDSRYKCVHLSRKSTFIRIEHTALVGLKEKWNKACVDANMFYFYFWNKNECSQINASDFQLILQGKGHASLVYKFIYCWTCSHELPRINIHSQSKMATLIKRSTRENTTYTTMMLRKFKAVVLSQWF